MYLRELVDKNREAILRIAKEHGASNVRIFGSLARGEARSDSDMDILVNLEEGRSLLDHAALVIELEELLNCKVDVITERGLKKKIREKVLKEAVPL